MLTKIVCVLMILVCQASADENIQRKFIKRDNTLNLYPDIQITDKIYVAGNRVTPPNTVYLKSISAIEKEGGRCAVTVDYEIYNEGAIDVNNRFYSAIQTYDSVNSSRLVDGIAAGESKVIETIVWLRPGELTNALIYLDNNNNVREFSEKNNTQEITMLLSGNCEEDLSEPVEDEGGKKGLLKRFEFKVQ